MVQQDKIEEEYIPCNLCGKDDYSVIHKKLETSLEISLTDKFSAAKGILSPDQIVKCRHCGLVYTNPRIRSTIILDSCSQGDDEVYVSQEEGRKETFEEGLDWIEKETKKREDREEKTEENKKVLDVGCAAGFFLSVAKQKGYDTYGIELNAWLAEYGRKKYNLKNVKTGTLETAQWQNAFFDYITMWDVLEHVPDPLQTLKETNRITKKEGHIIISYPDYSSIFAKMFGRKWWFLLSHHIYYFTPTTMKALLEKAGYEVVTEKMHWQKLKVVYMLDMFAKLNNNSVFKFPATVGSKVLKTIGLESFKVRYYASQRDIIAKKIREVNLNKQ